MGQIAVPEGYERDQWHGYVRRGRKAIKAISDAKFDLGETVIEMLGNCGRGHGEVTAVLTLFARQIGSTMGTLENYRYVAAAWPSDRRRNDVPWSVHKVLAPEADRFSRIWKQPQDPLTGDPTDWTYDQARREREMEPRTAVTRSEKVEHATDLLRDTEVAAEAVGQMLARPEVARRVARDEQSRKQFRKASYEYYQELDAEADAVRALDVPAPKPAPSPGGSVSPGVDASPPLAEHEPDQMRQVEITQTPAPVLRILGLCTSFNLSMRDAIIDVQGQDLAPEGKAAVQESLGKVREICGWCEDAVVSGRTGLEEGLARLLESEGGEGP